MVNKWLGRHSESMMSSSFHHYSTSEHYVFTALCSLYSRYIFVKMD